MTRNQIERWRHDAQFMVSPVSREEADRRFIALADECLRLLPPAEVVTAAKAVKLGYRLGQLDTIEGEESALKISEFILAAAEGGK